MSRADSPLRDRMLFLVGAQRSGTNWLQGMLKLHPDVVALPSETQLLSYGIRQVQRQTQQGPMESWMTARIFMEPDDFADAARDFCDAVFGQLAAKLDSDARYILERTPNHAEHMDLVADLYPDGRVIHIIRDGRDVVRSVLAMSWGPDTVGQAAKVWRRAVQTARTAGPRTAAYVEVRYEDLLVDPKAEYTRILNGVGLSVDPRAVEAAVLESGIPVNIDPSRPTIGSGKWRTQWTEEELAAFDAEAGELLYDELGYPRLSPSGPSGRRGLIDRARSRVQRTKPTRGPAAAPALIGGAAATAQRVTNNLIGFLADGKIEDALNCFAPDAQVRIVTHDDWRGRGAEAFDRFQQEIKSEGPGWGRQVRGHVYFAMP